MSVRSPQMDETAARSAGGDVHADARGTAVDVNGVFWRSAAVPLRWDRIPPYGAASLRARLNASWGKGER